MIDLEFVVIDSFLVVALREKVVIALVRIENVYRWQGVQIEQLLRDRTYQIVWDGRISKRCSGKWITYRSVIGCSIRVTVAIVISKSREVAVTRTRGRNS